MGISIFENKTPDIFSGLSVKAEPGVAKTGGDDFSKVFEGCVDECADGPKPEVFSEGVKAAVNDEAKIILSRTTALTGNTKTNATSAEGTPIGPRAIVSVNHANATVSIEKTEAEPAGGEGVPADPQAAVTVTPASVTVSVEKTVSDPIRATGVPFDSKTVVTVSPASVAAMSEEAQATVEKDGYSAEGPEKPVTTRAHTDEERTDERDEAKETGKSVPHGQASLLGEAFVEAQKPTPTHQAEKAAVDEAYEKSPKRWNEAARAAVENAEEASTLPRADKTPVAENVVVKTVTAHLKETLNTEASMKAAVVDAAAPEKKSPEAPSTEEKNDKNGKTVREGKGVDPEALPGDKAVSIEKAGIKAAANDKGIVRDGNRGDENRPARAARGDERSGDGVPRVEPLSAQLPQQAKEVVEAVEGRKNEKSHPVAAHTAVLRDGGLNDVPESERPDAGLREKAVSLKTTPEETGLSSNHEEKGGKGRHEGWPKAGPVEGLSHGAIHANAEKFPSDALSAKPADTVKPEAVFERLSAGVRMSLGENGKEVSLSLAPEHLGSLHIKMSIEESSVKARIIVENEAAKTILDSDSGRLREVFARHGLTLDKYTVELGTNAFSGNSAPFSGGSAENPFNSRSHRGHSAQSPETCLETRLYGEFENTRRTTGGVDLFA